MFSRLLFYCLFAKIYIVLGTPIATNNDSVLRNQTNLNNFANTTRNSDTGSSNTSDSGFNSINRTNHDRFNNFTRNSNVNRPSNPVNQNSSNTSFLPPPNRSNNVLSNPSTSSGNPRISSGTSNNPQDNDIVCTCNEEAKMFTVRKEGPNTGEMRDELFFNRF